MNFLMSFRRWRPLFVVIFAILCCFANDLFAGTTYQVTSISGTFTGYQGVGSVTANVRFVGTGQDGTSTYSVSVSQQYTATTGRGRVIVNSGYVDDGGTFTIAYGGSTNVAITQNVYSAGGDIQIYPDPASGNILQIVNQSLYRITIPITNNTSQIVRYDLIQDGVSVGSEIVMPGQTVYAQLSL